MTHTQKLIHAIKQKTGLSANQIGIRSGKGRQVSKWESGKVGITYNEAIPFCESLGVELGDLLKEIFKQPNPSGL